MDTDSLLADLLVAMSDLGVDVRIARFGSPAATAGGLVRLRGKPVVLLDERSNPGERVSTLLDALLQLKVDSKALPERVARALTRRRGPDPDPPTADPGATRPGLVRCRPRRRATP